MCGIVGFVGNGSAEILQSMVESLYHRGPDEQDVYIDLQHSVFLGHTRLAILDLTSGQQPMFDNSHSLVIVFNGEIYNHRELRKILEAKGHIFQSNHSDTEVLLYGYREWGTDLPLKLNGMFAFTIYDLESKQLFMARDRFGEKPLYYFFNQDTFAFASELKTLALHPNFDNRLSMKALQKFFAYSLFPANYTPFEKCQKLPAGSWLKLDLATNQHTIQQYWKFRITPDNQLTHRDEPRLIEEFRYLLTESVHRRLQSDVPLGVFLSGGIDSSSVLSIMTKFMPPEQIEAFTIGFDEASFDESIYAKQIAEHFSVRFHQRVLNLSKTKALIPQVLSQIAEPIGDSSILPTFMLCQFAREKVTVALTGDGGDELFAGYDPFQALSASQIYSQCVPAPVHQLLRQLASKLPTSTQNMSLDFKIKRWLMGLSYPKAAWNVAWLSALEPQMLPELFQNPLPTEEVYEEVIALWDECESKNIYDKSMEFYTNFYLMDNILKKVDMASMANSLETRAVFLDNDLVEFCQKLPAHFKYRDGSGKYLYKKAMKSMLPTEVLQRKKKGFGVPMTQWLREMPPMENQINITGMNLDWINKQWQAHRDGSTDQRLLIWCWLNLQHYLRSMADSKSGQSYSLLGSH